METALGRLRPAGGLETQSAFANDRRGPGQGSAAPLRASVVLSSPRGLKVVRTPPEGHRASKTAPSILRSRAANRTTVRPPDRRRHEDPLHGLRSLPGHRPPLRDRPSRKLSPPPGDGAPGADWSPGAPQRRLPRSLRERGPVVHLRSQGRGIFLARDPMGFLFRPRFRRLMGRTPPSSWRTQASGPTELPEVQALGNPVVALFPGPGAELQEGTGIQPSSSPGPSTGAGATMM